MSALRGGPPGSRLLLHESLTFALCCKILQLGGLHLGHPRLRTGSQAPLACPSLPDAPASLDCGKQTSVRQRRRSQFLGTQCGWRMCLEGALASRGEPWLQPCHPLSPRWVQQHKQPAAGSRWVLAPTSHKWVARAGPLSVRPLAGLPCEEETASALKDPALGARRPFSSWRASPAATSWGHLPAPFPHGPRSPSWLLC